MVAIWQNFWLNYRHNGVLLTNRSISSQNISIFNNCQLGWHIFSDFERTSPFGKVSSVFFVLSTSGVQIIQSLCGCLIVGAAQFNETLVNFDAWDDASGFQDLWERGAIVSFLMTPEMFWATAASEVNKTCLYKRRFSALFSKPRGPNFLVMLPVDSSAAKIPLPGATIAWAILANSALVSSLR
ncbi:hypothetical protein BpHYR1_049804 [Brachionus plicatilis]|uniref:Uncharacterized protein n=1 Tax=Brachionus plicatilis TaxID=10195 RepID=A0A3M7RKX2_BRAPC|nr:hypothetical protein BpHYR1_049804 [Brachionus plicatilis]